MEKSINTNNKTFAHAVVIIALMFGFGYLPPVGSITPFGMKILGVFLSLIYSWSVGIVMLPCLISILYLATIQNQTLLTVFSVVVGNQTLIQVMIILAFAHALDSCGLLGYIGNWILSLSIIKKGPYWFLGVFFVVAYIGSGITFNHLGCMIMLWSIFWKISDEIGIPKFSKFSNTMMLGMAIIGYHGSVLFPFNMWPNVVWGLFKSATGVAFDIPVLLYMSFNLITGILAIAVILLFTKFVIRPEINFDMNDASLQISNEKMTSAQKFAIGAIVVSAIMLVLPSFVSNDVPIIAWISSMGVPGIFLIATILLSLFKNKDGNSVAKLVDNIKYGINFEQFFLLGLAFYMASQLTAADTGIAPMLVGFVKPILAGKGAAFAIIFFVLFGTILTNCINNVVSCSLMLPFILSVAPALGINMQILMIALTFMLLQGCALPSGSVLGGVLHSTTERLKAKDIYIYCFIYTLILGVIVAIGAVILNEIM